jgi:hypothetical protein
MTVFDSLGNDHSLTAYFVRDSTTTPPAVPGGTASWQIFFSMDGLGLNGNALPPAGTATPSGTLCFRRLRRVDWHPGCYGNPYRQ